jgi:hypothetical protein
MFRFAHSGPARAVGRLARRSARLVPLDVDWSVTYGPEYGNGLGQLELRGRSASVRFERAVRDAGGDSVLRRRHEQRLTRGAGPG